jgi:hypothetical protein
MASFYTYFKNRQNAKDAKEEEEYDGNLLVGRE